MDNIRNELSRRNLFRFLGNSVVFLPLMRTLMETQAFGQTAARRRAVFYFYPCGTVPKNFHPTQTGATFVLPASTKPLAAVQNDILMLNNVKYDTGGGDGSRHQQGNNYGLTGCEGKITNVSIDTYLGQKAPGQVPALRLGVAHGQVTGDGMHNAVSFTSASVNGGNPNLAQIEDSPSKAFTSIFGGSTGTTTGGTTATPTGLNSSLKKSLLDSNLEQINGLQKKLGTIEKTKLDSHIAAIRELERRIQVADSATTGAVSTQCTKNISQKPNFSDADLAKASNFDLITDLQTEVIIQAMACGATNVAFLTMSHGTSGVLFKDGKPATGGVAHHSTSHYGRANSEAAHTANQAYMMSKFAAIIKGMSTVKEGDKTLLYNSSLMAFSEISDGDAHNYANMGLVVAGQGGGYFKTGRCVDANGYTHNNLLVSMLQAMGLPDTKFGNKDNGKGPIPSLSKV